MPATSGQFVVAPHERYTIPEALSLPDETRKCAPMACFWAALRAGTMATMSLPLDRRDGRLLRGLLVAYVVLLVAAAGFFRYFALEGGMPMNADRAIFWAINSITCTGFRLGTNSLAEFSRVGIAGVFVLFVRPFADLGKKLRKP